MRLLIPAFLLISLTVANAQTYRNSVRIGVDYMSVDAPDALGFRSSLRLARNFVNDRFVLAATAGYFSKQYHKNVLNDFSINGDKRERFTADLTLLVNLLKNNRHALRVGVGPSTWFRRDKILVQSGFSASPTSSVIPAGFIQYDEIYSLNIGWHVTGEYAYLITPNLSVDGRFILANLQQAGISSLAGIGLGYHF